MAHERKGYISTSGLKSDVTFVFLDPRFPLWRENFGDSAINKRKIAYFSLRMEIGPRFHVGLANFLLRMRKNCQISTSGQIFNLKFEIPMSS